MLTDKNFFILKSFQDLYPDKPPFYFWILSLIKIVSKEHFYFFNIFIGSTLFGFGILILTYKLIKNLKNSQTALFITLSLETIPFFIGVSVLQRMDIMMSFFISLALYFFFGFYYNFCKISIKNLSIFYFSIFMGVFTKGVAGIAIPILVIFIFLILEKNLKFLKEIKFIRGFLFIILFITLSLETIPFFIGVSVLQRMDIMMSFFISLALYFFFGFYYNFCKISIKNLSIFYLSIFMGVFTKGVAGIAIPILVIFIFLILEKNLKFLKEIKFIRGFLFIIFLFGLWFYAISLSPNGNE